MNKLAVITGDISSFTKLDNKDRANLIYETEQMLFRWVKNQKDAAIFRGDSYQILFEDLEEVMRRGIQLICWFKLQGNKKVQLSTRLSIGIGSLAYRGKTVLDSDGEVFHLSGRAFDDMAPRELVSLATNDRKKDFGYQILLMFMNMVMDTWTPNQAEVIYWMLEDEKATQESIAKRLTIAQSGVAKSLRIAHWKEILRASNYLTQEIIKA